MHWLGVTDWRCNELRMFLVKGRKWEILWNFDDLAISMLSCSAGEGEC